MKLEIRPLGQTDREAFRDLMALRPGYTSELAERRTDLVWHIAFENPTTDGKPNYFVATDGARILCHMGRMPTLFQIGERSELAAFAHDLFAHPELQATGAGFFTTMKLYKTVEQACPSFCGLLWTNEINIKLQQSRKYTQSWVHRWGRPLDLDSRIAQVLPEGVLRGAAQTTSRVALRAMDTALGWMGRAQVSVIEAPDVRFDELSARIGPKLGIAPVKDRAYVAWKYFGWPNVRTTLLGVDGDAGELRGFIVLRQPEHADDPGRILDLVVDPQDDAACASLLRHAIGRFRDLGLSRIELMATFPPLQRGLRNFLFQPREPAYPFFFLNDDKFADQPFLVEPKHWSHAFGDSEGGEVP